ncbi:hypothetical protein RhiirA4_492397, partial [Rhizophagus irregularis]
NLASKTYKTQLSVLGIYPEESAFQKAFETILEQEKPGYIEKHNPQWMHIYSRRIEPLCHDIIKFRRYDKAKEIRAAMFDIFGENLLAQINTNAAAESICEFKKLTKTKRAFKCLFKVDDDGSLPYIQAIRNKAWGKKKTTEKDTAFTLAVCEV